MGTSNPSQKLEVAGNILVNGSNDSADGLHLKDRTFIAFSDAGSVVSRFRSSAAGVFQFQDGSYNTNVVLNNNGNSYFNGGNVGIGTTSPSTRLELAGYKVASSISDVGANSLLTINTTVNTGINLKAGITNNYNAYIQGSIWTSSPDPDVTRDIYCKLIT